MKKLLLLSLLCSALFGCKSNLDKKIVLTEYKDVIEKIKTEEKKYTEEDYKTASKKVGKYLFQNMATPNKPLDITYGQILDDAHALNLKNQQEVENYKAALTTFSKLFTIIPTDSKYTKLADEKSYSLYNDRYDVQLKLKNNTSQIIAGIKGMLYIKNEKGDELISFLIKKSEDIPANSEMETVEQGLIMDDDNLTELKALPFNKLKFEWRPEFIIYKDGSRVEGPKIPDVLYLSK